MNSPISRLHNSVAQDQLRQPDIFERSVYVVDEIAEAGAMVAVQLVELRTARIRRSIGEMELANNAIAKLLRQSVRLNTILADQIAKHQRGQS